CSCRGFIAPTPFVWLCVIQIVDREASIVRASSKKTKILVLHNGMPGHDGDSDTKRRSELNHLHALAKALSGRKFAISLVDVEDDPSRISHAVVVEQPDLIFNLVHQFRGD